MPPIAELARIREDLYSFNPSKEMTAVPPDPPGLQHSRAGGFQPLKGNDGRAAQASDLGLVSGDEFQPLKGNDGRAAENGRLTLQCDSQFQPLKGNDGRAASFT